MNEEKVDCIKYEKKEDCHIFIFEYNENIISYSNYYQMIDECGKWYKKELKKVDSKYRLMLKNKNYKDSLEISKMHKKILINLIKKIASNYEIINNIDFGIFISNSFARGTNLIDSDFDLNFVYEEKNKQICMQIEEQISYALTLIAGKYRDFVHDSITHKMNRLNKNNDIVFNEGEKLFFINKWKEHIVKYEITKGNERLLIDYCYGKRDINSYIKYFSYYEGADEINEWMYYQEIVIGKKYVNKIFKDVLKKEKAIQKLPSYNKDFNELIENTINSFKKEIKLSDTIDFTNMRNIKAYFKNKTYNKIFTVIAFLKKKNIDFDDVKTSMENFESEEYINYREKCLNYFGNIMIFNYVCDMYKIEFRTRYSKKVDDKFDKFYKDTTGNKSYIIHLKKLSKEIYLESIKILESLKYKYENNILFEPRNEYINIENYSPFSYINEVSKEYQKKSFMLPFIEIEGKKVPVHPDTFDDLKIDRKKIIKEILVYPTSSFRTVYDPISNKCYKLSLLRRITRSIRNMPNKELQRSEIAQELLEKYTFPNFTYLKEKSIYNKDENFNYIIRKMPNEKTYPWFYVIASQKFSKEFELKCIKNIISSFMFFASKGIYFESPHTQNYLVDENANIYYRDLSDIRSLDYEVMKPSFYNLLEHKNEMLSIFFDRAICNQNIDHMVRYCKEINNEDIEMLKEYIISEINRYKLDFPDYSMDYSKTKKGHIPERIEKVKYR